MSPVGPGAVLRVCGQRVLSEAGFCLASLLPTAKCIFSNMFPWACQLHSSWDPNKYWLLLWGHGLCFQADSVCLLEPDCREMHPAASVAGWQFFKHFLNLIQAELTSGTALHCSCQQGQSHVFLAPWVRSLLSIHLQCSEALLLSPGQRKEDMHPAAVWGVSRDCKNARISVIPAATADMQQAEPAGMALER